MTERAESRPIGTMQRAREAIGRLRRPEERLSAVITIENALDVIDQRNRLFPGWWTYGAENLPDHSQVWLHVRNQFYPGWWTTKHSDLFVELKPLYRVRCRNFLEVNLAIFTQPKNVSAQFVIGDVKSLEDVDWLELIQPPFYYSFNGKFPPLSDHPSAIRLTY